MAALDEKTLRDVLDFAVESAQLAGSFTLGYFNASPQVELKADRSPVTEADIAIEAITGPEVIMGSTRMKSGTAQKMILNTISTGVMIRLGHVYSNLMIDMPATNEKLRSRAVRMVELAAGVPRPMAVQAIREANGNVRQAIDIAKKSR